VAPSKPSTILNHGTAISLRDLEISGFQELRISGIEISGICQLEDFGISHMPECSDPQIRKFLFSRS